MNRQQRRATQRLQKREGYVLSHREGAPMNDLLRAAIDEHGPSQDLTEIEQMVEALRSFCSTAGRPPFDASSFILLAKVEAGGIEFALIRRSDCAGIARGACYPELVQKLEHEQVQPGEVRLLALGLDGSYGTHILGWRPGAETREPSLWRSLLEPMLNSPAFEGAP